MRVDLPSGAYVEIRDKLKADDKMATQGSFHVAVDSDGKQQMPSGIQNILRNALLERIITSWGGGELEGVPIPSVHIAGAGVLGELDIDDYNALAEAVDPLLEKVTFSGPNRRTGAATQRP